MSPNAYENPDDVYCWYNMLRLYREWCSPKQLFLFCEVAEPLYLGKYYFNANKKVTKKRFSMYVRNVAKRAGFDMSERCTGHAPRKRCHDLLALNKVPLGK